MYIMYIHECIYTFLHVNLQIYTYIEDIEIHTDTATDTHEANSIFDKLLHHLRSTLLRQLLI